jgi:hypothetical protein
MYDSIADCVVVSAASGNWTLMTSTCFGPMACPSGGFGFAAYGPVEGCITGKATAVEGIATANTDVLFKSRIARLESEFFFTVHFPLSALVDLYPARI